MRNNGDNEKANNSSSNYLRCVPLDSEVCVRSERISNFEKKHGLPIMAHKGKATKRKEVYENL